MTAAALSSFERFGGVSTRAGVFSWARAHGAAAVGIGLSIALHLVLLQFVPSAGGGGGRLAPSAAPIEVRLSTITVSNAPVPVEIVPAPSRAVTERKPAGSERVSDAIAAPGLVQLLPQAFDEDRFLPSALLPVKPIPIGHIAVPFPQNTDRKGTFATKLTIYIDEHGAVVRVNADADLPLPFQEAAVDAFLRARFQPGRLDDEPVKTRMRVEVIFEDKTPQYDRRLVSRDVAVAPQSPAPL